MFQALINLHKLFSKRYFVLFFDKEEMPEEGTFITIGDLYGKLKKEKETNEYDINKPEEFPPVWQCRKCGHREIKK